MACTGELLLFATSRKPPLAWLFLDLDTLDFKWHAGAVKRVDELLCWKVARRFIRGYHDQHDVIGHGWGGDEFVLLMTEEVTESRLSQRDSRTS